MFTIGNDESYIDVKLRYEDLLRKVTAQGGMIGENDRLQTLLGALPQKIDLLREAYYTKDPAPRIQFLWDRMYDIDGMEKKRALQSEASGMLAEVYYHSARGRVNEGEEVGAMEDEVPGGEVKKNQRIVSGVESQISGVGSALRRTMFAHSVAE